MSETFGERQAAILRAAVREYVRSGEPVGSRHLVERSGLDVSPATVRNEMARLEDLGFLMQPHTSAGRIPTDRAYRFVVDEIHPPVPLAAGQRRALESELDVSAEPGSIEDLLRRASDVVSRFTHHATAVLARRARPARVRRLELILLNPRTAMAVVIADNGRVEQRVIPLERAAAERDVDDMSRTLGADLDGAALEDALRSVTAKAKTVAAAKRPVVEGVADALEALLAFEDRVWVGGVANLAEEESFERPTLGRLYEVLERQTALLELLATAFDAPLSVRIGSEMPAEELRRCSLVVANFGAGADARGSIGVIGPMRMDYERVIAMAGAVARMLEGTLQGNVEEP